MVNLMAKSAPSSEVKTSLYEVKTKIQGLSQLYHLLSQSETMAKIRLDRYLSQIVLSVPGIPNHIELKTQFDSVTVPVKKAVPIGLMLTELLTNAIKYAFPEQESGTITICLEQKDDKAVLQVADDGIGIPEHIDTGRANSVGFRLIYSMTEQIDGRITIDGRYGTQCRIEFPYLKQ
jgi:two-component sensor histidine kinase